MEHLPTKNATLFAAIGAMLGWFALIGQFYLAIENRTVAVPEAIIRYFSYFTILTNILVAFCFTSLWLKASKGAGNLFTKVKMISAITLNIAVVGITYNTILRFIWAPQGMQRLVDELLHLVIPIWMILYWFIFVSKNSLQWKDFLPWLIYPALYCVYVLIRGAYVGYYPYPFMDVTILGYQKVVINCLGIVALFLVLALILVGITKVRSKQQ